MKNKSIYIIVRFSVITSGVRLGVNISKDEYKKKLFSEDRLSNRMALFKKITSKSIISQKKCGVNLRLIVLSSLEMPEKFKKEMSSELEFIEKNSDFSCDLVYINEKENLNNSIKNHLTDLLKGHVDHDFATVRLDDDDGIASSYCKNLEILLNKGIIGVPISFAYGYEGYFDEESEEFENIRHWYHPKIALGLAFTNSYSEGKGYLDKRVSIYGLGNHQKIDINNPILIDSTFPAYFRTMSLHNDSGENVHHQNLIKVKDGEIDFDEFQFIERFKKMPPPDEPEKNNVVVSSLYSSSAAKLRKQSLLLKKLISEG